MGFRTQSTVNVAIRPEMRELSPNAGSRMNAARAKQSPVPTGEPFDAHRRAGDVVVFRHRRIGWSAPVLSE